MESRIQRLVLAALLLSAASFSGFSYAQDDSASDDDELGQIITPDIKRRTIKEDDLNSEIFEVGAFTGILNIEDFGSNAVQGVNVDIHITESFFIELVYAVSSTEKTSYELLSGGVELLTEDQRDYSYYNGSLGYNFLPGQIYFSDNWTFNNHFYLVAGAGNTLFADKDYFTATLGAGLRFYATDWLSIDLSMRGHNFSHELFGEEKSITNLESRFGLALFF